MNNYQNNESLRVAKARLKQAEEDYACVLEQHIMDTLDLDCSITKSDYERFLFEKYSLVTEYVMDMGVWAIQEQFLKDYHYLEKYIQLSNCSPDHHSEYEGPDEEREIEILQGIQSKKLITETN